MIEDAVSRPALAYNLLVSLQPREMLNRTIIPRVDPTNRIFDYKSPRVEVQKRMSKQGKNSKPFLSHSFGIKQTQVNTLNYPI